MTVLPPLLGVDAIQDRLRLIFPSGTPNRTNCVGKAAARTVFVMLYVGAIEGGEWLAPKFVYRMGNAQASKKSDAERLRYLAAIKKPGTPEPRNRWYKENTREQIRDDALRDGLVLIGGVLVKADVTTTSSKGRYALRRDLADLFDPALNAVQLERAAAAWRSKHLTKAALASVQIQGMAASGASSKVPITLPDGSARTMSPGLSSILTKAIVEVFAPMFLRNPAVLWISESGKKVVERDDKFLKTLGITIDPAKLLPDVILADSSLGSVLWVFVEIVATDGPIDDIRRSQLLKLVVNAGFSAEHVLFVTAFHSRTHSAFKKVISRLAWGSLAWCMSEPEHLMVFDGSRPLQVQHLDDLLR